MATVATELRGEPTPLTVDEVLSTTRSVRKRLDLTRPVPRGLIEQCLQLAQQAPTSGNSQAAHYVVVTDPAKKAALTEVYVRSWNAFLAYNAPRPTASTTRTRSTRRSSLAWPDRPSTWPTTWRKCQC
jgi:nitroreductase